MKDFLHKYNFKIFFSYFPIVLFSVFLVFFVLTYALSFYLTKNQIQKAPVISSSDLRYPIIKTEFVPQISAKGAIIMDADSKIVLYSKNPDIRFSTASTTKIMTALVGLEQFKQDDILTVINATSEGAVLGLFKGQSFTFKNLLYAMLLPSANDAALAIADNYPGGENAFVLQMNKKAKDFNLSNTHYGDASGLFDQENYTTPFDLARLAAFSIQNENLRKTVSTKQEVITDITGTNVYYLNNLNKLLGIDGVNGIKTGYTEEAGQVLVTSKVEKGKTIIVVVMGSEDRFSDTQKLLSLINNNLTYLPIHP
ncbi:MAG: hypothetical protein A2171_02840 [Candidatus Levybacteria bacterium RBG_13_35_9]|nr:MAG: hypothetical protein A2171_02840 [Candidatus Levybacteria bacterium RBG_13_35_9]